jgi:hypothetical protein
MKSANNKCSIEIQCQKNNYSVNTHYRSLVESLDLDLIVSLVDRYISKFKILIEINDFQLSIFW